MFTDAYVYSGYSVNDASAAMDFYSNTLGIDVTDNGMGLELNVRDSHPIFIYAKSDHTPASYTVLNFVVEDIDKAVDELVSKGLTMERYESMPQEADDKGILRGKESGNGPDIAWFKDPAGNILSVQCN